MSKPCILIVFQNNASLKEITDPSGAHTLFLLDRKVMEEALTHHTGNHYNELILRGDLPAEVTLSTTDS